MNSTQFGLPFYYCKDPLTPSDSIQKGIRFNIHIATRHSRIYTFCRPMDTLLRNGFTVGLMDDSFFETPDNYLY